MYATPHDKTNKMTVRSVKTQISLGICKNEVNVILACSSQKSIPKFLSGKNLLKNVTLQILNVIPVM